MDHYHTIDPKIVALTHPDSTAVVAIQGNVLGILVSHQGSRHFETFKLFDPNPVPRYSFLRLLEARVDERQTSED